MIFDKRAPVACLLALLLGGAASDVSRTILTLEAGRSLGHGALADLLASDDTAVATRAALAIGRTMLPGGAAALADHIGDRRPPVRAMSIYGLGLLGLGSDAGSIAQLATSDASGAVRIAALDALERYEAAKALDATAEAAAEHAIAGALAHDSDRIVRGRGAIALFDFASGAQSRAALAALLRAFTVERDAGVRERVMWTIFRGYAKMVPRSVLQRGLRDPDEVVRIEAVRAYGKIDDPDFIYDVEPLAHDPSWRVQEQAMETLRVLKGGKMTEHLSAIPASVHVPPAQPDPFAHLAALPRPSVALGRPSPARADLGAPLLPVSAADMTSPAHGPHPRMRMITTKGNIYIVLYPEWAPLTVENFLNLTARGFYDDNRWFRIVPDFVVQTGEKDDKNAPGPGYTIGAEENPLEQSSYVISMGLDYEGAKAKRDSAGSEYYITISPQYHLDRSFTVFGAVTSGYDVLGRLVESDRVVRIERVSDITL